MPFGFILMHNKFISQQTSIITSFAKNGNPKNPEIAEVDWKPVESEPYNGLIIDQELKIEEFDEARRILDFWEKLFEENGANFC
jgi:carboxylesterase type B